MLIEDEKHLLISNNINVLSLFNCVVERRKKRELIYMDYNEAEVAQIWIGTIMRWFWDFFEDQLSVILALKNQNIPTTDLQKVPDLSHMVQNWYDLCLIWYLYNKVKTAIEINYLEINNQLSNYCLNVDNILKLVINIVYWN